MGIRDSRTTHPRKRARQQRALERFTPYIGPDAAKAIRKNAELLSLRKSLGL